MGCEISKLPEDTKSALDSQKNTLESIYASFQPMEDEIQSAIQKKKQNQEKIQEILAWKNESEKKILKLESIIKQMHSGRENNSDEFIDINSVEIQIEDQHEELIKIIAELKSLS
jgi:2-hydroxy-3-keto-5-methylthiopentenyl-1-phosphate phosphatase